MAISTLEELKDKIVDLEFGRVADSFSLLSRFTVKGSSEISYNLDTYWFMRGYEPILPPVDTRIVDTIVSDCQLVIADDLKSKAENYIRDEFLVYYEFYSRCIVVADDECETAFIMFNEFIGEYEIHYNKKFILEKAIIDSALWGEKDKINSMVRSVAFVFMHEMNHALRYHMVNQNSAVNGINPKIINIMGDSFINTELKKSMNISVLYNCIDSKVTFKGKLKKNLTAMNLGKELFTWYKGFRDGRINSDLAGEEKLSKGEEVEISVTFTYEGLKELFAGNSNIYIIELTKLLSQYLETESASSGSGKGAESSDSDSSGGQGSSSSGSDSKSDGSGESGSGSVGKGEDDSSGNKSEDKSERNKADETLDNKSAQQKAKSNLEDAVNSASSSSGSSSGSDSDGRGDGEGGGGSDELLKSLGADKMIRNFNSVQTWRGKLNKLLRECLGTTEKYNSELANARIEGQYGREEDINVPKRIILGIDCSVSMGPDKFKQVLNEVENFILANKYKRLEVVVIYWGSTAEAVKFKLNKGLVQRIISSSKGLGGTSLYTCIDLIKEKYRKFDLCIIFTDGEIEYSPKEDSKAFLKRVCNRVVWVLTKDGYKEAIKKYDSGFSRRLIQAK